MKPIFTDLCHREPECFDALEQALADLGAA